MTPDELRERLRRAEAVRTRRTLVVNRDLQALGDRLASTPVQAGGRQPRSQALVPVPTGGRVGASVGVVLSVHDMDREDAISESDVQVYDLVLADVQMPEMDGLETTRRAVARWGGARPRIVAMTANAMHGDREVCLAAGMDDYITKPIRVEALAQTLQDTAVRS